MVADPDTLRAKLQDRYGVDVDRMSAGYFSAVLSALDGARPDELEATLVAAATVAESTFLRHRAQFDWITGQFVPRFVAEQGPTARRTLRVLSAACACGEEAYSLVASIQPGLPDGWSVQVVGVDVCAQSLDAARQGTYTMWSMRGVDHVEPSHWLEVQGRPVTVSRWVRDHVDWAQHNLLDPLPAAWRFDLILCRNMMIYFHPGAIHAAWTNLQAALAPGGAIIVGPSDPDPTPDVPLVTSWAMDSVRLMTHPGDAPQGLRAATKPPSTPRVLVPSPSEKRSSMAPPPMTAQSSAPPPEDKIAAEDGVAVATFMLDQRRLDLALHAVCDVTATYPDFIPGLVLQSLIAVELGDTDMAVVAARRAAYLDPDAPYLQYVLADAFQRVGESRQAAARRGWAAELLAAIADEHQVLDHSEGLTARQLRDIIGE